MDDKTKQGQQDRSRVNVNEDYEVDYWTGKFNVSKEELVRAVDEVGPSASAVEEYLKKQR